MEIEYYRKYEPIFGEYTIKSKIGDGSSGDVFEIEREDVSGRYSAALKAITIPRKKSHVDLITAQHKDPSEYYKTVAGQMQTEVELMAELKGHTNIVSYENHKLIQHDDGIGWDILIQMELLTPLYKYAALTPLDEEKIVKLGIDICSALDICHKHNIIHRDVKPENIFVNMDGDFELGDFGIAKVFEETKSGTRIGTDSFMAPEIFNYKKYGSSVDIYSLGLVMHTMLNDLKLPFEGELTRLEANDRRMMGEKIPAPKHASKALSNIILKAAQYNVEDRYKSAEEMKRDLLRLKAGEDVVFEPEEVKKRKSLKKKVLAGLFMLIIAAACIFALIPKEITDIGGIEDEVTILYGDSIEPEYVIEPERFSDEKITFETGDENIASVDEKGKITAENIGKTSIDIRAMEYEKNITVNVEPKISKISGLKKSYSIYEGESLKLNPLLSPEKYDDEKISYESDDKSVLTVSKNGKITGKSKGEAEVTVSAGGFSIEITVTVKEKQEIKESTSVETESLTVIYKESETNSDDDSLEWE